MGLFSRTNYNGDTVPIYTTRKAADGQTFTYSIDLRVTMLLALLLPLLALIWTLIGLVYAGIVVVNAVSSLI